ncbi:hypothetical protein J1N35_034207 [Gossypium stocksii]|uniref:Uncharacterized protein n=1 Tax=Gossypium stocksii TaxID=47602 RepID=A0A9D3URK5_9ROSI|nr:hypothetical protein J1N35_034207 [Gossypium stocksii]
MKLEEDIKEIFYRFTIIISRLNSYGKTYPNEEVVRKVRHSLPTSLEAKVIAIEERSNKQKAYVAAWSDEDSSDDEVANLCLMAINDPRVTFNSSTLNDYSFDELQDAYDGLGLEFEVMISKHRRNISKLRNENNFLSKTGHELEEKVNKMQEIINDFEKKNLDLHNLLSKVHEDNQKQLELLKSEKTHFNKVFE